MNRLAREFAFIIVMMLLAPQSLAADVKDAPKLPEILTHSKLKFGVYRGDTFTVSVKIKQEPELLIQWVKSGETLCRELTCKFDTNSWALGSHKLTFVVFNGKGSRYLRYRIRILAAPPGYKPGEVVPEELGDQGLSEGVAVENIVVKSIVGKGYSYHGSKLQVVSKRARNVDWTEGLKTQTDSVLRLTRVGFEEHLLAPKSSVGLGTADNSRRYLKLRYGSLRSRNFGRTPKWSVLVGDWLQVDSDNYGDVIVQTKKDSDVAYVTVLRGHARVYQGVDDKESGGGMSGRAVSVAAGVQVEVKKGDTEPIKLVQPKASSIGKVVLWTSPYLKPNEKMGDDRTETPLIGKKAPKKYKAALALAEQALAANDPLLAIEALKPFEKKMKYRGNIALGRAYMGAFLYKQAFGFLKKARKQNDDLTEAHFLTGYLYLSEGRWSKAIQYLEDVDPIDKEQEQLVEYYLGVANYYLGSKISARNHFEYSRWAKVNEGVEASAQEFLKDVDSGGWLDLRFFAGAAFDSNILRASDDTQEALPLEIDGISGSGYVGGAGFTLNAFKGDAGHVLFGYDFKQTGYVNPTYAPLTLSEQSAFFDFILGFGGEEFDEHYFAFGARLEAAAIQLGENRAMDQMKADVTLASPVAYGLGLKIVNMQNLDPLPGEEDSLDPILWEMVATGDRSNRVGLYGLELSPIKSSSVNLETEILFGESKMRHDLQQSYNHKISIVNLDLRWMLSLRTHFDFDLGYLTRDFSESDDSRKDSQTKFGVGWRWYFTTSLSQLLAAGMENQSSSRDSNTYSRTTTQYSLHLDF